MAITADSARTEFEKRMVDLDDVDNTTFYYWCDYINKEFYRYLRGTDPERLITTTTYTVSTAPTTETLPADFRDMQPAGCGLFERDASGLDTTRMLPMTGFGDSTMGYYITGASSIVFTGINTSTTFVMRYIPNVDAIDGGSDEFAVPDEYNQYIIEALTKFYQIWDENPGEESIADFRYARALSQLLDSINRSPKVFDLGNWPQNYSF